MQYPLVTQAFLQLETDHQEASCPHCVQLFSVCVQEGLGFTDLGAVTGDHRHCQADQDTFPVGPYRGLPCLADGHVD